VSAGRWSLVHLDLGWFRARERLPDAALRFEPAAERPGLEEVSTDAVRERALPKPQRVAFVHDDLKLDDRMFDPADADGLTARFDWDMTTLGDPLVDRGTLLGDWPVPAEEGGRGDLPDMDEDGAAAARLLDEIT
jgi:aminoglycoside phosphotransferase (APT) family kinase protein